jgi:hypothetical protein
VQHDLEISRDCISATESQRVCAKMRKDTPRKTKPTKESRTTITLPKLACLGDWKPKNTNVFNSVDDE